MIKLEAMQWPPQRAGGYDHTTRVCASAAKNKNDRRRRAYASLVFVIGENNDGTMLLR